MEAMTYPPIKMSRLDAKFIAQMYKDKPSGATDAKKFLKYMGYLMPPIDELLAIKKALVGNGVDLEEMFDKYDDNE